MQHIYQIQLYVQLAPPQKKFIPSFVQELISNMKMTLDIWTGNCIFLFKIIPNKVLKRLSKLFKSLKPCLRFYSRPRFRLRLRIKIVAPVKLCRTRRKFMGLFLTRESKCLQNLKRKEPY